MTREETVQSYTSGYENFAKALKNFPKEMWQFRPAPGKWSIHEIIIHMADSEAHSFCRARKLIAESGSSVMVYDQDKLAISTDYHNQNTDDALELFGVLRKMTANIIKKLPDETWNNYIMHPENGRMSMDDWLRIYEEHVTVHINQMKRNFEVWQKNKN